MEQQEPVVSHNRLLDTRQKGATSSHANVEGTASGVFLMAQHFDHFALWFMSHFRQINLISL